ncbi:MAG: putative metal-dependent hydrolase [Acidobacteriota bacterium]|nr:putative metal-dependent hydrolase [Acidobacteriota bacterium]
MDLSYPIGRFDFKQTVDPSSIPALIGQIEALPAGLRDAVRGLDAGQLDTPYRPGGWTVRQTVHHVADSHMNSYIRLRLALTEGEPTIKPYDQPAWAELADTRTAPVDLSLDILTGMHARWAFLLRAMEPADFHRSFRHPELGLVRLDTNLALYAWHGRHHTAHIVHLRQRMGW